MRTILAFTVTAATVAAQLPFVSPAQAATTEGSLNNSVPFQTTGMRRYQQVHGDLPQQALSITRLSFRINATTTPTTYAGTRALDFELLMANGPSSYADASRTMSSNFFTPPTVVMARRTLNWGPYGTTAGLPGPEPFTSTMDIPLDAPFVWLPAPTPTLVWEAVMYASPATGTNPILDADASSATSAPSAVTGPGCTCTGRTAAHTLSVSAADVGGVFALAVGVANGPTTAPVYVSLGLANLNFPFPGLCSNVLTDLTVFTPLGTTSATGAISNSTSNFGLALANTFQGLQLFLQAHAVDSGLTGLPVCNSEGRSVTVPLRNTTKVVEVTRMWDSSNTTTATWSNFFTGSAVGFGVVTLFQ